MTDSHAETTATQAAPTKEPGRLDLRSHDIAADKQQELLRLFPEIRTEGGTIDFDRLKRVLGDVVDPGKERYGMNWPGKAECFKAIQSPSLGTLRPARIESVEFASTKNIIVEGDNLEVLKLLQKAYLASFKLVYIDPPYNTGNDVIYPDNFSESLQTYLEYTGQVDAQGRKFSTNTEADGRFHSKWMNMMYPRLYLAKNLLRRDGVILISIDDNETDNLRKICNEVFGEENFIGVIVWKGATDNNPTQIAREHEYVVCYARSKDSAPQVWKNRTADAKRALLIEFNQLKEQNPDASVDELQVHIRNFIKTHKEALSALTHYDRVDARGLFTGSRKVHNPKPGGYRYDVIHPNGKVCTPPINGYRYPEATMRELIASGRILFGEDETQIIQIKEYLEDYEGKLSSVVVLDSRTGSNELTSLFGRQKVFPNPKPSLLLRELFDFILEKDDSVLDFFAGSGTTADAVFQLNSMDGGKRQFVLVQLPEPLDSSAKNNENAIAVCDELGVPRNTAELTKERVRRAATKTAAEADISLHIEGDFQDRGFRVLKLDTSNFIFWSPTEIGDLGRLQAQLDLHIQHVRAERGSEDILFELLLKSGFPASIDIKQSEMQEKIVYGVANGLMLICLERELTTDLIKALADQKPERVMVLDEGFAGNDQLKTNAVQLMKAKGVTSFRTV
jgi:adenine-specific DNA-methyltransferase